MLAELLVRSITKAFGISHTKYLEWERKGASQRRMLSTQWLVFCLAPSIRLSALFLRAETGWLGG